MFCNHNYNDTFQVTMHMRKTIRSQIDISTHDNHILIALINCHERSNY